MVGQVGGLRVDFVAEDAGPVEAELGLGLVAERQAGGEEGVVADVLNDGELRAGNMRGEEFGAGIERDDSIRGAGKNLNRDGDSRERIRRESRTQSGCDGEDGTDAWIAMWLGAFAESGLKCGIGSRESAEFGG